MSSNPTLARGQKQGKRLRQGKPAAMLLQQFTAQGPPEEKVSLHLKFSNSYCFL